MNKYTCYYYRTARGDEPAKEFIDSLDSSNQRKFFVKRGWLEQYGPGLPKPHAKYIGSSIYELRFGGKGGAIRVLYFFFQGNNVIFTNGFKKKTRIIFPLTE